MILPLNSQFSENFWYQWSWLNLVLKSGFLSNMFRIGSFRCFWIRFAQSLNLFKTLPYLLSNSVKATSFFYYSYGKQFEVIIFRWKLPLLLCVWPSSAVQAKGSIPSRSDLQVIESLNTSSRSRKWSKLWFIITLLVLYTLTNWELSCWDSVSKLTPFLL